VSLGYSFVQYLEEGNAPIGAFLSLAGRKPVDLELDLGWQRSEGYIDPLHTFTMVAGPRFESVSGESARPFLHVLGGVRHDRIESASNTAWGGFAGGGIDLKAGEGLAVRFGADLQIFFDQGWIWKTLRVGVGVTF
jgi:hypothetical protein